MEIRDKLDIIRNGITKLSKVENEIKELQEKRDRLKMTIAGLWEIFDICPRCKGKGRYFQRSCAEDDGDIRECPMCFGKGTFPKYIDKNEKPEMFREF